jgi:hypothetical protein
MENVKNNFMLVIVAAIALITTVLPLQSEAKTYTDVTMKYIEESSYENTKIINDFLQNTEPYIFPIITGTIGAIGGGAAVAATGAGGFAIAFGVVTNGIVGYVYGYGVQAIIDRHIYVPYMLEEKSRLATSRLKREYEEFTKESTEQYKDAMEALGVNGRRVTKESLDEMYRVYRNL